MTESSTTRDFDNSSAFSSLNNYNFTKTSMSRNFRSSDNRLPSLREDKVDVSNAIKASVVANTPQPEKRKKTKYHKTLGDDWEITKRDSWWYSSVKDTPSPMKYSQPSFIQEIAKKPNTYRFKSNGRKSDPLPHLPKGSYLLPGAYNYEDLADRVKKIHMTYGFKNQDSEKKPSRHDNPGLGPGSYDTTRYLSIDSNRETIKHSFFKSKQRRRVFNPKQGPSPGQYELKAGESGNQITSCFVSETSRFKAGSESKSPIGPGSYDPISVWIESKQSKNFSENGVFFTPSAKVFV